MGKRRGNLCKAGGFTYIGLLVVIVIIGISTTVVSQTWRSVHRIQKEEELLWVGHQYRQAIEGYYMYRQKLHNNQPGQYYPSDLKDLQNDPGRLSGYCWLRELYVDPITGKDDWVLVRTAGGIKGVHSASDRKPIKMDWFDKDDESFKDKTRYSEWVFEYPPLQTSTTPPPGGGAGGAGGEDVWRE